MIRRIIFSIHRVLGTILSIMFLVWFLSGFVMIYRSFPRISVEDKNRVAQTLPLDMPPIDSVLQHIPADNTILKLDIRTQYGQQIYRIITADSAYQLTTDFTTPSSAPTYEQVESYAGLWCEGGIAKVDTLYNIDQWIPFNRLKKDFPIYKFYFDDADKHQLYISSKTGEALQLTDKDSRFWAWLGAIPHWVYFTLIRQDAKVWSNVVIWLSGAGSVMCLAGLAAGSWVFCRRYKAKRKFRTPYRKFSYKWHHILGFVFGFFTFTFVFSGMMSVASVPDWIAKTHTPVSTVMRDIYRPSSAIGPAAYKLDYRELLKAYPHQVKSIEWRNFGCIPTYKAVVAEDILVIDASKDGVCGLHLNEADVVERFANVYEEAVSVSLITEYDSYYLSNKRALPLPVYKVTINDADNSVYYVNPETGDARYYNRKSRVHKWMYQGFHSFNIKFLVERPVLWNIVMWTTMLGGTLLSATGVWLGYKWVRRKLKRVSKRLRKKK